MFFSFFPKTKYDFFGDGTLAPIPDIFRYVRVDSLQLDDLSLYQLYTIRDGERPDVVSNLLYSTPIYHWTFFVINDHLKAGMQAWPMSQSQFDEYISQEYAGQAIETRPQVIRDADGLIVDQRNSLADRFELGETVTGFISGAVGTVSKIDIQLSQLIVQNQSGFFQPTELIVGQATGDSVSSYRVYDYRDAPHHYQDALGRSVYDDLHIGEDPAQVGSSDAEVVPVTNFQYETALNDQRSMIRVIRPDRVYDFARAFREALTA